VRLRSSLVAATLSFAVWFVQPAWAATFSFNAGAPDGRLGALSRPASAGKIETETADDFILSDNTLITHATITGLVPLGTPLGNITQVEVELYNIFPLDSGPFDNKVPTRANSPSDVEIASATRDSSVGTLTFTVSVVSASFMVANTVANNIAVNTHGEGPATGEEVQISITFTTPIFLPAGHYFFRPEVLVNSGDFLYLSSPRPGPIFAGDLQAWIRNTTLKPDWLRIGTDIIDDTPAPTFNMAFSLTGDTVPNATDVTSQVIIGVQPFQPNRNSRDPQSCTVIGVTNPNTPIDRTTRATTIAGPLEVVLTNLTPNVTLVNPAGTVGGFPFALLMPTALPPGAEVNASLCFLNPGGVPITFIPLIFSGALP
jgi:hypothetical protein